MMPGGSGPPTVAMMKETVDSAIYTWQARREEGFGKVRQNFQEFSETILSFSDIFSIIPQGDKYISLFTGVISTVVKVSITRGFPLPGEDRAYIILNNHE